MTPSTKIVAILAGGKAVRFGSQDKGKILIKERRLIDIIHERIKPQSDSLIISGRHDYGLGFPVVADATDAPDGPVGGIYSVWKHLEQSNAQGFFTVAIDGPNLPRDLTAKLYAKDSASIAADDAGRHPTYGWWLMEELSKVFATVTPADSLSLNRLADLGGAKIITWEGDKHFLNINRKSDLERL